MNNIARITSNFSGEENISSNHFFVFTIDDLHAESSFFRILGSISSHTFAIPCFVYISEIYRLTSRDVIFLSSGIIVGNSSVSPLLSSPTSSLGNFTRSTFVVVFGASAWGFSRLSTPNASDMLQ
ncbi:hypothetical protein MT325_m330R [Paramecium bursaria chlorella virus MT325]|uniref:Uncharacterized protein m330R n=1 Tax=Paramecium bursaria Chlorella virus MT325 TaxID=346932 RepID=A7IU60_PBCVM|nr:hypothetical protein MT325_m330R [Paramecium bursaria chlorella virus MT325]